MSKAKNLILVISLFSCSAMAQNIDVGSAATGALVTVLIRGAIAFCLFKLITLNLTRKTIDTPTKAGRWVGAWLMGVSILTNPSFNKSDLDFYIGSVVLAIVWFAIGFAIGFIWRKFKPLNSVAIQNSALQVDDEKLWEQALAELNSTNKNEGLWAKSFAEANGDEAKARAQYLSARVSKLKQEEVKPNVSIANEPVVSKNPLNNPLIYVVALVIIGGGLILGSSISPFLAKQSKDITFGMFTCKDPQSSSDNCERVKTHLTKFIPNKGTQKVTYEITEIATNKFDSVEMDCNVKDDKNWRCFSEAYVGKPNTVAGTTIQFSNSSHALEMKNGVVTDTGMTLYSSSKYSNTSTYIPAKKFVQQ